MKIFFVSLIILFISVSTVRAESVNKKNDNLFNKQEQEWRTKRDQQMLKPTSWLTIAGLFWLEEGGNSFGTDPSNKIVLPKNSAPIFAGKFMLRKEKIVVIAQEKIGLKIGKNIITRMTIKSDETGQADEIELNELRMWVIKRGERYAIRLRDFNNPGYKNYKQLVFYPPSKKYKILADYIPYESPKKITVATIVGTHTEMISPGYVKFAIDGKEHNLKAFGGGSDDKNLFFIFKDNTNGNETYEASRFMSAEIMDNNKVLLNFNRAFNPPCAYTPYATCPLPPPDNYLSIPIEAGEKKYPGGHS